MTSTQPLHLSAPEYTALTARCKQQHRSRWATCRRTTNGPVVDLRSGLVGLDSAALAGNDTSCVTAQTFLRHKGLVLQPGISIIKQAAVTDMADSNSKPGCLLPASAVPATPHSVWILLRVGMLCVAQAINHLLIQLQMLAGSGRSDPVSIFGSADATKAAAVISQASGLTR
jgi:hypothetical protein